VALHLHTLTVIALGVLHLSQKLVCGIYIIARYGGLGGLIRIQWQNDAMRPQTHMLDAVASRGTLTRLLGATCCLIQ
ncbi:MAG: hypothetical protein ACKPKO_07360, partial [Candidatus Fonsibacter sp.]